MKSAALILGITVSAVLLAATGFLYSLRDPHEFMRTEPVGRRGV